MALRAAAAEASQAASGHVSQAGKPAEPLAGADANIQRRTPTAPAPSQRAGTAAQHAPGAFHSSKAERHTAGRSDSTPRLGLVPRSVGARPAGQQKAFAKSAWQPRGLAQQKQQLQYEMNAPVGLLPRQAPSLAAPAPGSAAAAAEEAPLRKRAEGGRKRRK